MEVKSDSLYEHVHIVWLVKSPFSQQHSNKGFLSWKQNTEEPRSTRDKYVHFLPKFAKQQYFWQI